MISAKDARAAANKNAENTALKSLRAELVKVEKIVRERMENGLTMATMPFSLSNECICELVRLGYTVSDSDGMAAFPTLIWTGAK